MNTTCFTISNYQICTNTERVCTHFITQTFPPRITCLNIQQGAVQLTNELDSTRGNNAVDRVSETIGKGSNREEFNGLCIQGRAGWKSAKTAYKSLSCLVRSLDTVLYKPYTRELHEYSGSDRTCQYHFEETGR